MPALTAIWICLTVAVVAFGAPGSAWAADRVPKPEIAKAAGTECVRDADFMRANHMRLLRHQRDATVHRGRRPDEESLKGCLTCHAVPDAQTRPVGFDSPEHFCRSCHDYAAVSIDCFECHAARPPPGWQVKASGVNK